MSRKAWCSTIVILTTASVFGLSRADDNDTYNSVQELEAKRKQRVMTNQTDDNDTYNSVKDLEAKRKQRVMASQTIWWEHFIPGRLEEKKKIAEGKTETANKEAREKEAAKPKPVETGSLMQQEMQKYLRREEVCNRLRVIADETKDPELARQADLLESRAKAAYEQKVSSARLSRMSAASDQDGEMKSPASAKNKTYAAAGTDDNPIHSIPGDGRE